MLIFILLSRKSSFEENRMNKVTLTFDISGKTGALKIFICRKIKFDSYLGWDLQQTNTNDPPIKKY